MLVLLALGLTLIFGLMNVVNFAHGALYMTGAYALYFVLQHTGSFWIALILAPILVGLTGLIIERTMIRRLYQRSEEDPILLTFGLAFILMEAMRLGFGKIGLPVNLPAALSESWGAGWFRFPSYLIFTVACSALAVFALWLFLEKTDMGLVIRAGSRDSTMVQVLGLDFDRVRILSFMIGTALAGLAGALAAPVRGVIPEMGQALLPQAFVVVVVGGKGSFWGTVASGLLVGITVALTSLFYPSLSDVIMYVLMTIVLLIRPRGLFGRE